MSGQPASAGNPNVRPTTNGSAGGGLAMPQPRTSDQTGVSNTGQNVAMSQQNLNGIVRPFLNIEHFNLILFLFHSRFEFRYFFDFPRARGNRQIRSKNNNRRQICQQRSQFGGSLHDLHFAFGRLIHVNWLCRYHCLSLRDGGLSTSYIHMCPRLTKEVTSGIVNSTDAADSENRSNGKSHSLITYTAYTATWCRHEV